MIHPNTPFADGLTAAATDIADQRRKLNAAWDALQLALQAVHPDLMLSPNGGVMEKTDAWEASDAGNGQVESFQGTAQLAERIQSLQAQLAAVDSTLAEAVKQRDEWRDKYNALEAADALVTGALADAAAMAPAPAPLHEPDDPAAAEAERVARVEAETVALHSDQELREWADLKRRAEAVGVPMMSTPPPPDQFVEVAKALAKAIVEAEDAEGERRQAEADAARDEARAAAQETPAPEETKPKRTLQTPHWTVRSDIVKAEQFMHDVYDHLTGRQLTPQEIHKALGLEDTDAAKTRVGSALRAMEKRRVIERTGVRRRPPWMTVGRYSDEWQVARVWRDRDGNTWEKSPANPQ